MEEGVDTGALLLDDIAPQSGEGAGAGRPGVHGGRDAARQACLVGDNAVVGNTPVHVGVEVNETGRDVAPGGVERLSRLAGQIGANRRDLPILHQHVGRSREVLAGIEYGSTGDTQVVHATHPLGGVWGEISVLYRLGERASGRLRSFLLVSGWKDGQDKRPIPLMLPSWES